MAPKMPGKLSFQSILFMGVSIRVETIMRGAVAQGMSLVTDSAWPPL